MEEKPRRSGTGLSNAVSKKAVTMPDEEEGGRQKNNMTGLMNGSATATEHIACGFWMQGDFVVFLTIDEANFIYIETYVFENEEITPIVEKIFLCDSSSHEHKTFKVDV